MASKQKTKSKPVSKSEEHLARKCEHLPVSNLYSIILPGKIAFNYFLNWQCYYCGIKMKAVWK
jgi:hypothetical protein